LTSERELAIAAGMAFDHYLPATYLAIFSDDANPVRRERGLYVLDKLDGHLFPSKAGRIGGENDLYRVRKPDDFAWPATAVDEAMSTYEPVLHIALDEMIGGTLDARMWAATCVAFVVGLLVRGPDFTKRFERRVGALMQRIWTPDDWMLGRSPTSKSCSWSNISVMSVSLTPLAPALALLTGKDVSADPPVEESRASAMRCSAPRPA
jgi:hypothetical protein